MHPNTECAASPTDPAAFLWSSRLSVAVGLILAVALAAAKFAPLLAAPLEWQG